MKITREFVRDGRTVVVTAELLPGERWRVRIGDVVREYHGSPLGDGGMRLQPLGEPPTAAFVAFGAPAAKAFMVRVAGHTHTLEAPASRGSASGGSDGVVRAPMTGTVLDVACKPGDVVAADQTLVVVSAMKMEHKLVAGIAGTVRELAVTKGALVEQGAELVVVEPAEAGRPS